MNTHDDAGSGHAPGIERVALVTALYAIVGVPVLVALVCTMQRALSSEVTPVPVALVGLFLVAAFCWWGRAGGGSVGALARRLSPEWDGAWRRHRAVGVLWAVLALASAAQTTRLACFMSEPELRWGSVFPPVEESARHACLPAYVHAAELAGRGVDNLYDEQYYPAYHGDSAWHGPSMATAVDNMSSWMRDPYEYPPPFLLLPRAGLALTNDYLVLRSAWFAIKLAFAAGVVLLVAFAVGGRRGRAAVLLAPAIALSACFGFDLQFGQAHFFTVALAVAGMLAFARGRDVAGGALLGFAIVCKLFPGLLVLYLLVRRRWRPAASTALWAAAWTLLGLVVLGWAPYEAFVGYQLPRISSGEAFAFFLSSDSSIAGNWGVYGIPIKLGRLGVPGMTTNVASALSWLYTIPVVVAAVVTSRGSASSAERPAHWIALLALASLRSPLAPGVYVGAPGLWLLSLVAIDARRPRSIALFVAAWLALNGLPPLPGAEATILFWMISQLAMFATCFWVVFRRVR